MVRIFLLQWFYSRKNTLKKCVGKTWREIDKDPFYGYFFLLSTSSLSRFTSLSNSSTYFEDTVFAKGK